MTHQAVTYRIAALGWGVGGAYFIVIKPDIAVGLFCVTISTLLNCTADILNALGNRP